MRSWLVACCAVFLMASGEGNPAPPVVQEPPSAKDLLGSWRYGDGQFLVRFDAARVVIFTKDDDPTHPDLEVYGARYEPGRVVLRKAYQEIDWKVRTVDDGILLTWPFWEGTFRKLDATPPEVALEPCPVGTPKTLPRYRVERIQRELRNRVLDDKPIRDRLQIPGEVITQDEYISMLRAAEENAKYLTELIAEVGWIASDRFGEEAARSAFFIVFQSDNLPLILAAVPRLEADVRAGRLDAEMYAELFDRLRMNLAEKQRYGTRVLQNPEGEWVIAFLEDPAHVDDFRRELGLGPVQEVADAFQAKYGREVRIVRDDG